MGRIPRIHTEDEHCYSQVNIHCNAFCSTGRNIFSHQQLCGQSQQNYCKRKNKSLLSINTEGNQFCLFRYSHKKRKDSLEGSLDRELFAAGLEFPKVLVSRNPQNSSNVNIENPGKPKQLYSLCDQLLGALIYLHFIILILICF